MSFRKIGSNLLTVALLAAIKSAERNGDSAEMIRLLETLAGARGDSFDVVYRLAATISRFAGDAPKALGADKAAVHAAAGGRR